MTAQQIEEIIILQRSAFHQESVQERREHLGRLESAVKRYEQELALLSAKSVSFANTLPNGCGPNG